MSKFTEAKLEQAFIELLENEGFPHFLGNTIARADDPACADTADRSLLRIKPSASQRIIFLLLSYKSEEESVLSCSIIDWASISVSCSFFYRLSK